MMRFLMPFLAALALATAIPASAATPAPDLLEHTTLAQATAPAAPPVVAQPAPIVLDPVQITGAPALPSPNADLVAFAGAILTAFQARNWGLVSALALVLLVWLARRFGGKLWPFLLTDRGGALLSLVGGLALAIAAAAAAPGAHGFGQVLAAALLLTVTASGTYALLKKMLFPSGADAAQLVAANAGAAGAAVQAGAAQSPESAAAALNGLGGGKG